MISDLIKILLYTHIALISEKYYQRYNIIIFEIKKDINVIC